MLALLLIVSTLSSAQADDPVAALESMGRVRHACSSRLPALETAHRQHPGDHAIGLERGLCLHAVGRYDQALPALASALSGARLATLVKDQPEGERAAVVYGVLLAWKGHTSDARAHLRALRAALGANHPGTRRATILLQAADGDTDGAWSAARALWGEHPKADHSIAILTELTAREPDRAPPWAREVISQPARTLSKTNRASGLLTAGRYNACVTLVDDTLAGTREPAEIKRLHVLGHRCGAHGGDLRAANSHMLKLRDLSALEDQAVLAHADLLAKVDKVSDALRLVELAKVDDPRGADTRRIRWNLALGRLDAAYEAGAGQKASPESRATLGLELHKAGREDDAAKMLEPACAELTRGAAHDCKALLERATR